MRSQIDNDSICKPQTEGHEGDFTFALIQSKQTTKAKQKKNDIEEVLHNVLVICENFLCVEGVERENFLGFLDPVISDSQCHIHSMLIMSKLLQVYDEKGTFRYNIKNLSNMDRELLSYAVLFSVLKYEEKDKVGFVMSSQLVDYLGIFCGKMNAERKIINRLKETFNSSSIDHLKGVTSGKIKEIFTGCDARIRSKGFMLQLQPCYAAFYALFKYMEEKNLPIVVPFVRFQTKLDESGSTLCINSKELLYYFFRKSKNAFVFKSEKHLSEGEKVQPTIAITCFSVVNEKYPEHFVEFMEGSQLPSQKFLTEDCDIRELLLLSAAGHIQLTDRFHTKDVMQTEDSVRLLYKKHSNLSTQPAPTPFTGNFDLIADNIYGCFEHHYKVAEKFGIVDARYSYRSKIADNSNSAEKVALIIRRDENTFFKFDHVNVSTYARESDLMNTYIVGAEVPLVESEHFDKMNAEIFIRSKLAEVLPSE